MMSQKCKKTFFPSAFENRNANIVPLQRQQREGKARQRARQAKPLTRQPNTRNYQLYKGTVSAV